MGEAVALTGFAVWSLFNCYTGMAPKLGELRDIHCDNTSARQRLMDADMCVGGIALLAGGFASWMSKSWAPVALVVGSLAWVSFYHHAALGGPTTEQIESK